MAGRARVECAEVHGKFLKLLIVYVAWRSNTAALLTALVSGRFDSQVSDLALVVEVLLNHLGKDRHVRWRRYLDLSLAAGAVQEAKGYAKSALAVLEQ